MRIMRINRLGSGLFMLLILLSFSGISQGNSEDTIIRDLEGTWVFDYDASIKKMNTVYKVRFDTLVQSKRLPIENGYKGRKVIFGEDGSYAQVLSNGDTTTATWAMTGNDKLIEVTYSGGYIIKLKIKLLTKSKMVLIPQNNDLISEWHFTKN